MKRLEPRAGYELYAADYRKDHPHLDSFEKGTESLWWTEAVESFAADRRLRIADLGCGAGRTLGRWERRLEKLGRAATTELWGLDLSPRMLEQARQRLRFTRLEVLDLENAAAVKRWRQAQGPVQVVSALFVLVHVADPRLFFAAIAALVEPGSRLIMNTIPQPQPPELRAGGKPIVIQAWDHAPEAVIEAGESQGFTLLRRQDFSETGQLVSTLLDWQAEGNAR